MKLRLETLAPVHIGFGAEIPPSEYWFDPEAGLVRRLNLEGLVQAPAFLPHLEKFVKEAAQGRQIDRYVPKDVLAPPCPL
jgi:CRISPR/Cas system CSM-associated protein Csm5 (group 7 of RAMP superfamily)